MKMKTIIFLLEWTCVGISKRLILGYFGLFYEIQFCLHAFNHELTVFDGSIDVLMQNYCEVDMFLCWVWILESGSFLISVNWWN